MVRSLQEKAISSQDSKENIQGKRHSSVSPGKSKGAKGKVVKPPPTASSPQHGTPAALLGLLRHNTTTVLSPLPLSPPPPAFSPH